MSPKVSVIIPTYKRTGNFLKRAIESVLNQTYQNIELIVVDDNIPNSKFRKETELFMRDYLCNNKVVYIKNKRNVGGALARNEGIYHAKGEYVTFLDDDDIYLPGKVENQLNFMLKNNYDMTFTDLKICNMKNVVIDYREFKNIKKFNKEFLFKYHMMRHITGTPTFMFKKKSLLKIGGFIDCKVGQEFYLMLKAIENDLKIGYLPSAEVIAYVHKYEKISNGINKIKGEKELFNFKKQYFDKFSLRERMFIRFRHHIVLAVTGLRSKDYSLLFNNAFLAFINSPIDVFIETIKFIKRLFAIRYNNKF